MQDIRIIFLGTGAGSPSLQRNVSSAALVMDGLALLFDCGEGTQHQLLRAPVRSGQIDAVFISHLHGDHVYGLPGLLATLALNDRERPLDLYGPRGLRAYVDGSALHYPRFEVGIHEDEPRVATGYRVDCALLDHTVPSLGWCVIEDGKPGAFDLARARALGIPEGPLYGELQRGRAITIAGRTIEPSAVLGPARPGRRIAFISDTRPCDATVGLVRGADILVHEATYGEELAAEAEERGHSTAAGAARVALAAGVRRLILTHFSTRYRDVQPLVDEARAIFANTVTASDFMEIPCGVRLESEEC